MKKLILSAVVLMAFIISCKKGTDSPASNYCRNRYSSFRKPNCGDTTDNFKFEAFNDSERVEVLRNWTSNPEVLDSSYGNRLSISTRHYDKTKGDLILSYRCDKLATLHVYVAYDCSQLMEVTQPGNIGIRTISVHDSSDHYNNIKPGCYRFYYVFGKADTVNNQAKSLTGTIMNKGHFDVEFL